MYETKMELCVCSHPDFMDMEPDCLLKTLNVEAKLASGAYPRNILTFKCVKNKYQHGES